MCSVCVMVGSGRVGRAGTLVAVPVAVTVAIDPEPIDAIGPNLTAVEPNPIVPLCASTAAIELILCVLGEIEWYGSLCVGGVGGVAVGGPANRTPT